MVIPQFRAEIVSMNGTATIVVEGELDIYTAPALVACLDQATESGDGPVVIDVASMSFIDSRGLSAIAQAVRQLGGRPLVLRSPSSSTRKVLDISGLSSLVQLED